MNKNLIKTIVLAIPLAFSITTYVNADTATKNLNNKANVIVEDQELFENSIQIYAKAGAAKNYTYWKIKDEGNYFKLVPAKDLKSWNLDTKTTFRIYDSNSRTVFDKTYNSGTSMKSIANQLYNVKMDYNYSFQIIPHNWQTVVRIDGYIGNNIDNHDYGYGINNFRASNCKFVLDVNGILKMEKVNQQGLSFLNNKFEFQTKTSSNSLKIIQHYNEYKLELDNVNGGLSNTVKYPFAIAIHNEINGHIGSQIYYKEIAAGTTLEYLKDYLWEMPNLKKGQYIQFIPSGTNTPGVEPKIDIHGGIINNINFYDYSNGLDAYRGSITAFKLTDNGLEVKEFTMK